MSQTVTKAAEKDRTKSRRASRKPEKKRTVQAEREPVREKLPDTRRAVTHKFNISGHEGYMIVGLYEDGRPGELFIKMAKQGSTISGLVDTIAILTSLALQYGVPVEKLAEKFEYSRFEPSGHTTNTDICVACSISDYVFTWLGLRFSEEYRKEREKARREMQ